MDIQVIVNGIAVQNPANRLVNWRLMMSWPTSKAKTAKVVSICTMARTATTEVGNLSLNRWSWTRKADECDWRLMPRNSTWMKWNRSREWKTPIAGRFCPVLLHDIWSVFVHVGVYRSDLITKSIWAKNEQDWREGRKGKIYQAFVDTQMTNAEQQYGSGINSSNGILRSGSLLSGVRFFSASIFSIFDVSL